MDLIRIVRSVSSAQSNRRSRRRRRRVGLAPIVERPVAHAPSSEARAEPASAERPEGGSG